jgi:methylmalonyl-CoA mutase cobalamin-binding subunit
LRELNVEIVDGGVSTDPNDLAEQAKVREADFIALSSYNGVALQFVADLVREMKSRNLDVPIFVGGKLNRVPDGSNTSLPVDVTSEILETGAIVCASVDAMLDELAAIAAARSSKAGVAT